MSRNDYTVNYIQQSLTDGEELVHLGHFHWMYNAQAILNIVFSGARAVALLVFAIKMQPLVFGGGEAYAQLSWIDQVRVLHPGVKILALVVVVLGGL